MKGLPSSRLRRAPVSAAMAPALRAFLLAALAALISALPAMACSCLRFESAAEQAQSAELIFIGRVIDSGPERDPRTRMKRLGDWWAGRPPPVRGHITTFQVDEALKGTPARNISLHHLPSTLSSQCGIDFRRGQALLVLAYPRTEGGYGTSLCALPQFPTESFRRLFQTP